MTGLDDAIDQLERDEYPDVGVMRLRKERAAELRAEIAKLRGDLAAAADIVSEIAGAGVVLEDERIDYVEIQVSRETWRTCKRIAATAGHAPRSEAAP